MNDSSEQLEPSLVCRETLPVVAFCKIESGVMIALLGQTRRVMK